jgi:small subunit ribosomal protein S18
MIRKKQQRFTRRKPVNIGRDATFSYKDVGLLSRFVTEQGSIVPRAETGITQKQQRRLATAIKRARHLALMPFTQVLG